MYLKTLQIANFKSFKAATFDFNDDINILTGLNNSGKTTVLEAIALWSECFRLLIKQERAEKKGAKKRTIIVKPNEYYIGTGNKNYYSINDIFSVRAPDAASIFYEFTTTDPIIITGIVESGAESIEIQFVINWSRGDRLEVNISDYKNFNHQSLNSFFHNLPDTINVVYASPIAAINQKEEFATSARIKKYINERESAAVLRNRLYSLSYSNSQSWSDFLSDLSYILYNKEKKIAFDFQSDRNKDVEAVVKIQIHSSDPFIDLSMVGSGTLQIIEILLALYGDKSDLNFILMDEPDSHIHRDIQKRLLEILVQRSKNNQVFLTTHNESLIRSSDPRHLFHVDGSVTHYKPIIHQGLRFKDYAGFQPGYHINILQSLGSESALEILNAVEADKIILVEGYSDAKYIDAILNTQYSNKKFNVMYWSFQGLTNLLLKLDAYKEFFSALRNKRTLWEKTVAVIDKDFLSKDQSFRLVQALEDKYDLTVFSWSSRTFEASLLAEPQKYIALIANYSGNNGGNTDIAFIESIYRAESEKLKKIMSSYLVDP